MPRHAWLRLPRVFVETPLTANHTVTLSAKPHHYLVNVRRLNKGDEVLLFNGHDGEWLARLMTMEKAKLQLQCLRQTRQQIQESPTALALVFAGIRREHQEYMIEKACELGVTDLYPVVTDHSQVRALNSVRLSLIATEAAEQSERLMVPIFHKLLPLKDAIEQLIEQDFHIFACLEKGETSPILAAMQQRRSDANIAILTGPEGGWSDAEANDLRQCRQVSAISLGERILRADTAAITALSCWGCMNLS